MFDFVVAERSNVVTSPRAPTLPPEAGSAREVSAKDSNLRQMKLEQEVSYMEETPPAIKAGSAKTEPTGP